jgi:DNA polymerase-3 subunit beta
MTTTTTTPTTRTPAPRVGDVILINAGACPEYSGAFRLRVEEIVTGSGRSVFNYPIIGGVVVNTNGRDRMVKGTPVERAATITDPARVSVVVPAPATAAEIREARAEHEMREINRTRCEHMAGDLGCMHVLCLGVPPVKGATEVQWAPEDEPRVGECGTQTWARDLRNALHAHPTLTNVGMPEVTCTDVGPRSLREFMVTTVVVDGHNVAVINWEGPFARQITAIMIDGELTDADVDLGWARSSEHRANMITWRIADAMRVDAPAAELAAPADVLTVARSLSTGDRVSVLRHGVTGGGYLTADPVDSRTDGYPSVTLTLCSLPLLGKGAVWHLTAGDTLMVLPADQADADRVAQATLAATAPETESAMPACPLTPACPTEAACAGCPRANIEMAGELGHGGECPLHVELPAPDATPDVLAELLAGTYTAPETETEVPAQLSVTVARDTLAGALDLALWSTPRRPSVPVLAGVLLTAGVSVLTVESFDYEVSSRSALDADVAGAGRVLVEVRALRDMVRKLPKVKAPRKGETLPAGAGMVQLTDTGSVLTVVYGAVRLSLPTMPVADYPAVPEPFGPVATVDGRVLADTVARVAMAAGKDATLPALTGVHVTVDETGRAVLAASDRYRLAVDALAWAPIVPDGVDPREAIPPALVPASTIAYVAKLAGKLGGPVTVGYAPESGHIGRTVATVAGAMSFTLATAMITTRCIAGDFPAVRALIPDTYAGTATVDAHALADVVGRVRSVAAGTEPVRLTWAHGTVTVAAGATDPATGEPGASETIAYTGDVADGFLIGFNPALLGDALRAFPAGTRVRFGFTDAKRPAVISADGTDMPNYQHMIMPVRIGGNDSSAGTPAGTADASASNPEGTEMTTTTDIPASDGATVVAQTSHGTPVIVAHVDRVDAPAPADAEPATPAVHDATERAAELAYTAMTAGRFGDARDALTAVRAVAPAGYRVAGRFTVAELGDMIDAAERAATPAAPADAEPADTDASARAILAAATWSSAVVRVGKGRAGKRAGMDVLTLPAGSLPRPVYTAVADVVRGLGGTWNRETKGFIFEPSQITWNGTGAGGRTASGASLLAAWLDRTAPAGNTPAEAAAPDAEAAAPDVMVRALALTPHASVSVSGKDGNGYPVQLSGYVAAAPVDAGRRGVRVMVARMSDGPGRPVYVRADSTLVTITEPAPPVAVAAHVLTLADMPAAPVLTPSDTAALAVAEVAAVAAIVAETSTPAADDAPLAPSAFRLAPYVAGGRSYRGSRSAVREALAAAGIRASVVKSDANRRWFTVDTAVASDRDRVAAIVAATVALDMVPATV